MRLQHRKSGSKLRCFDSVERAPVTVVVYWDAQRVACDEFEVETDGWFFRANDVDDLAQPDGALADRNISEKKTVFVFTNALVFEVDAERPRSEGASSFDR